MNARQPSTGDDPLYFLALLELSLEAAQRPDCPDCGAPWTLERHGDDVLGVFREHEDTCPAGRL